MDRIEKAGISLVPWIETGSRGQSHSPCNRGSQVRKNVRKEIGGDDDIVSFRVSYYIHTSGIDQFRFTLNLGIFGGDLLKDLIPEYHPKSLGIRFGNRGNLFSSFFSCIFKGKGDDSFDAFSCEEATLDSQFSFFDSDNTSHIRIFPLCIFSNDDDVNLSSGDSG